MFPKLPSRFLSEANSDFGLENLEIKNLGHFTGSVRGPGECRDAGIERKCREEKGGATRIADGEIKKERVSYYRDNWRDSNGQSEQGGQEGRNKGADTTPENESGHSRNRHLECRSSARAIPSSDFAFRVTRSVSFLLSRYACNLSRSLTAHAIILGYH